MAALCFNECTKATGKYGGSSQLRLTHKIQIQMEADDKTGHLLKLDKLYTT